MMRSRGVWVLVAGCLVLAGCAEKADDAAPSTWNLPPSAGVPDGGSSEAGDPPTRIEATAVVPPKRSTPAESTAGPSPSVAKPSSNPPPAQGMATVVVLTRTLAGKPVPNVPVTLRQVQPCNAAERDIPEGARAIDRHEGVTDSSGAKRFAVPLGCYRMSMEPPAGTNPVPEGMHSVFAPRPGTYQGKFRFQDGVVPPRPECSATFIAEQLTDLGDYLREANPEVAECTGSWAVIRWDARGDSQRIVRNTNAGWRTYLAFPHWQCWTQASANGVPNELREYFQC